MVEFAIIYYFDIHTAYLVYRQQNDKPCFTEEHMIHLMYVLKSEVGVSKGL